MRCTAVLITAQVFPNADFNVHAKLGAEKTPTDLDALTLAEKEARDGAAGVVFGRNAVQASNPPGFIAALHDVVKKGLSAKEAVEKHGLTG